MRGHAPQAMDTRGTPHFIRLGVEGALGYHGGTRFRRTASMSHAFEITSDDVATVLNRLGLPWDEDLGQRWADELDLDAAERAALESGDELDEQAEGALAQLEVQLRALGVPHKTLDQLLAERAAAELDATTPQTPLPPSARPRV